MTEAICTHANAYVLHPPPGPQRLSRHTPSCVPVKQEAGTCHPIPIGLPILVLHTVNWGTTRSREAPRGRVEAGPYVCSVASPPPLCGPLTIVMASDCRAGLGAILSNTWHFWSHSLKEASNTHSCSLLPPVACELP